MSSPLVQQTSARGSVHQERYTPTQATKSNVTSLMHKGPTNENTENGETLKGINNKIAQHLKSSERSVLWKYLVDSKDSLSSIQNGRNDFHRNTDHTNAETLGQKLKRKDKILSEITKTTSEVRRTKPMERVHDKTICSLNESSGEKQKEPPWQREKVPVVSARGDSVGGRERRTQERNQSQGTQIEKSSPLHITYSKYKMDTLNINSRHSRRREVRHEIAEAAKRFSPGTFPADGSDKTVVSLPRLVQSDLSERRLKANMGGTAGSGARGPHGLERALAFLQEQSDEAKRHADAPPTPLTARSAPLLPKLRESVSDARLPSRRSARPRKAPASPRGLALPPRARTPKVRAPRSLGNFLRAGFHPPEPGARRQASRVGGGGDDDLLRVAPTQPPAPAPATARPRRAQNAAGDDEQREKGRAEARGLWAGGAQNVPRAAECLRGRELQDHFETNLRHPVRPCTCSTSRSSGLHLPSARFTASLSSRPMPLAARQERNCFSQTVAFRGTPTFLQAVKIRKGRPVSRGPTKYRSVPILKGNLYLTMPCIKEESEKSETVEFAEDEEPEEEGDRRNENGDEYNKGRNDKGQGDAGRNIERESSRDEQNNEKREHHWNELKEREEEQLNEDEEDERKKEDGTKKTRSRKEKGKGDERRKDSEKHKDDDKKKKDEERRKRPEEKKDREEERRRKRVEEIEKEETRRKKMEEREKEEEEKRRKAEERAKEERRKKAEERKEREDAVKRKVAAEEKAREAAIATAAAAEAAAAEAAATAAAAAAVERGGAKRRARAAQSSPGARRRAGGAGGGGGGGAAAARPQTRRSARTRLRRAALREAALAAERSAAERVLARWAQSRVAGLQRQAPPAARTAGALARRRRGARKLTEAREQALSELWQSAKSAVRQGEKELLARAATLAAPRPPR